MRTRQLLALGLASAGMALAMGSTAHARRPTPEAGTDPVATDAARHDPSALREARGKVQEVDKAGNELVLDRGGDKPLTLKVDKSTTVFVDGRTATLDDIGAGEEVRASFEQKQGSNRAQWIEVSKKARKPSTSKETLPDAPGGAPNGPR